MDSQLFAASIGALVPSIMLLANLRQQFAHELPPSCNKILDGEALLRADTIYPHLECMGPRGREMYLGFYHFDLVLFPIIYLTFQLGTLVRLWPTAPRVMRWLLLLGALADVLENASMCFLLLQFPQRHESVEVATSVFTRAKWLLLVVSTLLLLLGGLHAFVAKLRGRGKAVQDATQKAKTV